MANDLLVFGVRPVLEAIESGKGIDRIYIKKESESPLIDKITTLCKEQKITVQYVPIEKLNRLTRNNHQGVIAQISAVEYMEITDIAEAVERKKTPALIVVLDSVTDVRNFGAIARSAECAGADALVVSLKNSAPVNGEAIKSSAGALNLIPVCRVGSIRNALKYFQTCGMQLVAATEKSDKLLYEADLTKDTVIIMGSEDKGISKEVLKMCDEQLSIPLEGSIGSLNVSAAAAVMLFEAVRQRKK